MKNKIAKTIKILAMVQAFLGFIAGIIYGFDTYEVGTYHTRTEYEFVWTLALIYWIGTFLTVIMLLAIAEIINLLQRILDSLNKKA
ncbi:hypothetical protein [Alkalihalobacterium elongatum]|uniref:hypothetical protein n=1 Tax=Alkalihalobacterium elongatum TaxID=2675466 RepID=UPI001C200308|nr:hypothetical protein [Alkalihalobacterium elongatum]